MKKVKILFAIITVIAMLSTVAFAADSVLNFAADTVEYTEGEELVISVYSGMDGVFDQYGYFCFNYDADVWSYVDEGDSRVTDYGDGSMDITISYAADVTVATGDKVFDLKFTKNDGAEAIGSVFVLGEDDGELYSAGDSVAYADEITVKAAEKDPEKVAQTAISAQAGTFDIYENVVVLSVDVALDNDAQGYGFDLTNGTDTKTFDLGNAISGDGTLEYVVAFWGVPDGVTITATPWVLK